MSICKNAIEYEERFQRLLQICMQKINTEESAITKKYKELMIDATGHDWKKIKNERERERSDLRHKCMIPLLEFEKSQPEKPIYVFKTNRRYYKLKIDWTTGEYTKYPKPIPSIRLLRIQKPGWVLEYLFPNSAFDFVICPNCKQEFTRYHANEKYCFNCQRSPRSKKPISRKDPRYCDNCGKEIPAGKNRRTKYCSGACRTAAFEKRKTGIISSHPSEEQ